MPTPSSRSDVPTATRPVPQPTHPVAGRSVGEAAPEFRWTSVPDAEGYRLQLGASEAFDSVYYDDTTDGPTTVALDEVLPDGVETVVWRVRVDGAGEAPWSAPASFTRAADEEASSGQFLVDAPPVPLRPVQGDEVDAAAATLTWEGVPEASGYAVQVSPTKAFDECSVDLTLDRVTTLTLYDELPEEQRPLHWRVRALFPNDTEGPWSDIVRFATRPDDVEDESSPAVPDETTDPASTPAPDPPPVERSPVAAGPAREAHTSSTMALVFIGVLVVSFLLTLLLVMVAL